MCCWYVIALIHGVKRVKTHEDIRVFFTGYIGAAST
jgi:hypothetical protein